MTTSIVIRRAGWSRARVRRALRTQVDLAARALAWTAVVPVLRSRARRRLPRLRAGAITIVTVNWNSWPYLEVMLGAVRRHSAPDVRVLVVDNHSDDESMARLRGASEVRTIRLPANIGHDPALDIGFLFCDTEFVVALDVDAFPLHDSWLDELLAPLDAGVEISGARVKRSYVHPCCLAMRTARFVRQGHSFRAHYRAGVGTTPASGDVGEEMSAREAGRLRFFEPTSQRGPGDIGTVFGDLVYHNFYSTRFLDGSPVLDGEVTAIEAACAWQEARARYTV